MVLLELFHEAVQLLDDLCHPDLVAMVPLSLLELALDEQFCSLIYVCESEDVLVVVVRYRLGSRPDIRGTLYVEGGPGIRVRPQLAGILELLVPEICCGSAELGPRVAGVLSPIVDRVYGYLQELVVLLPVFTI